MGLAVTPVAKVLHSSISPFVSVILFTGIVFECSPDKPHTHTPPSQSPFLDSPNNGNVIFKKTEFAGAISGAYYLIQYTN